MNPELWRTSPLLALASVLPIPLGALWMALGPQLPGMRERRALLAWITWLGTRVVFAFVVWGALGHQGIDQLAFFLPQARHALAGELPYRDFPSAYGPLFAPLLGLAVRIAGDSGPFLLFLLADFVAWRALAAADGEDSETAWGYAALPIVWYFTVRYAQDEALGAAFVALAYLAAKRDRALLAGLALGMGLVVTKPLFALLALPFVLGERRRMPLLAGIMLPVVVVYGPLLAWGAPVWQPLTLEGGNFGVGPTLWRVFVVLLRLDLGLAGWLPFVALTLFGAWWLSRRGAASEDHALWQFGAFAALAPKFMPMYAVLWAPQLCLWGSRDPDRRGWLLLYGAALPLAWYLDSGPLQGMFGIGWQVVAIIGLLGVALLALWPLSVLLRRSTVPSRAD